jgi:hypothetical protein
MATPVICQQSFFFTRKQPYLYIDHSLIFHYQNKVPCTNQTSESQIHNYLHDPNQVSEAKIYLYHSSEIAKAGPGYDVRPEQPFCPDKF